MGRLTPEHRGESLEHDSLACQLAGCRGPLPLVIGQIQHEHGVVVDVHRPRDPELAGRFQGKLILQLVGSGRHGSDSSSSIGGVDFGDSNPVGRVDDGQPARLLVWRHERLDLRALPVSQIDIALAFPHQDKVG